MLPLESSRGSPTYEDITLYLVSLVLRVHSHSCVPQHGLDTSGGHHNLLVSADDAIRKGHDHAKLNLGVVPWDSEKSTSIQLHLVNLCVCVCVCVCACGGGYKECRGAKYPQEETSWQQQ